MSSAKIPTKDWIASINEAKHTVEDFKLNHEDAVSGTYGYEMKGSRDWNEEIQVYNDLKYMVDFI